MKTLLKESARVLLTSGRWKAFRDTLWQTHRCYRRLAFWHNLDDLAPPCLFICLDDLAPPSIVHENLNHLILDGGHKYFAGMTYGPKLQYGYMGEIFLRWPNILSLKLTEMDPQPFVDASLARVIDGSGDTNRIPLCTFTNQRLKHPCRSTNPHVQRMPTMLIYQMKPSLQTAEVKSGM